MSSREEVEWAVLDTRRITMGDVDPSTHLYLYVASRIAPLLVSL